MGRQHDRALGAHGEVLELVDHEAAGDTVERRGRLVGDDEVGQPDHDAGDGNALLLAARQLVGPGRCLVAQAEQAQQMARPRLVPLRVRQRRRRDAGHHVLKRSQRGQQIALLEQEADAVAQDVDLATIQADNVGAEQPQLALRRPAHRAEDGEQRRLARPRRAGDDHQLALADLHVDVEQNVGALRAFPVVMVHIDRLDDRRTETVGVFRLGVFRHGHSNSMMGSTFHSRRMANRLDTTVMITQAMRATDISRRPMDMPRCIAASVAP